MWRKSNSLTTLGKGGEQRAHENTSEDLEGRGRVVFDAASPQCVMSGGI
jgi:hypothetical protein